MTLYFPSLPGLDIALSRDIGNFSTVTQESVTGKKTFFPTITQPRYTYTLDVNALWAGAIDTGMGAASLQALVGFYNQCYGSALSFQFTDPDDGAVSAQPFGTGDGATTAFQLVRGLGGFVESVYAPTGTPQQSYVDCQRDKTGRTVIGALFGAAVGQTYDGTIGPMTVAMGLAGILCFVAHRLLVPRAG